MAQLHVSAYQNRFVREMAETRMRLGGRLAPLLRRGRVQWGRVTRADSRTARNSSLRRAAAIRTNSHWPSNHYNATLLA